MDVFEKPISPSLAPNTELDDSLLALSLLFQPWVWMKGESLEKVERWFEKRYNTPFVASFNAGRSALFILLKSFGIGQGDEVLLQAFTCVAVPNSVVWAGARPVYIDIDNSLNLDVADAARKIGPKVRAIIVQHTFGIPADMDAILKLAKIHKLVVIEDCAHALGTTYKGRSVGSLGDAAFFSFGRDKVVSSVFGGMAIINRQNTREGKAMNLFHSNLPAPSYGWVLQQLLHPILFPLVLRTYSVQMGKVVLVLLQRFGLLSFPVSPMECAGIQPENYPKQYVNVLARLLLHQLTKLQRFGDGREKASSFYYSCLKKEKNLKTFLSTENAVCLRFPVAVKNPAELINRLKQKNILLGDWYHNIIDPRTVQLSKVGYSMGLCPRAEAVSGAIINLPTNVPLKDLQTVLKHLLYANSRNTP